MTKSNLSVRIIFAVDELAPDAGVAQLVEQLICNQQVGGSNPSTSSTFSAQLNMEEYPSGQRGQTVNLLALPSMVRIHPPPPKPKGHPKGCPFGFGAWKIRSKHSAQRNGRIHPRSVKKMCLRHIFSVGRSGCAARKGQLTTFLFQRTKSFEPLSSFERRGKNRFRLWASSFSLVRKGTKTQRATPLGKRIFSTPFLLIAYKRNGVEPPKKIRQRGASKSFGFQPLTEEHSFVKTPSSSFRCRCAGADLRYWCSLALAQQQAKYLSRSLPTARKSITNFIGAAAGNSGFVCPVTPRRSVEHRTS